MPSEFSAVLLAGGQSRRMGSDKALLDWQGRPLIAHMLDLLRRAGAARVVVSGDRPDWPGVPDAWPGRGPVGGLASTLPHCPDGAVVVVPIDLPCLVPGRISRLLAELERAPATHFAGHPLPCALHLDGAVRDATRRRVEAGPAGPSMRRWLASLGATALDAGAADDLRPCNTPADFAALVR